MVLTLLVAEGNYILSPNSYDKLRLGFTIMWESSGILMACVPKHFLSLEDVRKVSESSTCRRKFYI